MTDTWVLRLKDQSSLLECSIYLNKLSKQFLLLWKEEIAAKQKIWLYVENKSGKLKGFPTWNHGAQGMEGVEDENKRNSTSITWSLKFKLGIQVSFLMLVQISSTWSRKLFDSFQFSLVKLSQISIAPDLFKGLSHHQIRGKTVCYTGWVLGGLGAPQLTWGPTLHLVSISVKGDLRHW